MDTSPIPDRLSLSDQVKAASFQVNWRRIASRDLYRKPWMQITSNDYEMPGGGVAEDYIQVASAGYVEILPFDPNNGNVVLIGQYHWGTEKVLLKLPAGKIGKGKTPLQAAETELREETGSTSENIVLLKSGYEIGMWYNAMVHYYLAYTDAKLYAAQKLERTEQIAVITAPIGDLLRAIVENDPIAEDTALCFVTLLAIQKGHIDKKFLDLQKVD